MKRCAISAGKSRTATLTSRFNSEEAGRLRGRLEPEVAVGPFGRAAAPGRPLEQATLEQVGLVDVLDRVRLLGDGDGERGEADRAAAEVGADRGEDLTVETVQPLVIDLEEVERGACRAGVDVPAPVNLGVVAGALEQPVGDAGSAARALGDRPGAGRLDLDPQHARGADDDPRQVAATVVLEPVLEPEAVAQRRGQQPGARGG